MDSIKKEEQILNSEKSEKIMFIEGPPTMNGIPHAGHLRGRVIKDLWYRFNTLDGKKIIFNGGWDTQGLPVELQAEKELGITGGKSEVVRQVGIERLVQECKYIVKRFNKKWIESDRMLGMSFFMTRHIGHLMMSSLKGMAGVKQARTWHLEETTVIAYVQVPDIT